MNQVNSDRLNGELYIDFREFFWRLAEQWKAILVVALIVMFVFSGVRFWVVTSDDDMDGSEFGSQEEVLESLSINDREMVLSVLKEKAARDKLQEYIKNSPYMNLDPYRVNTVNMSWLITSEEGINKQLVAAYINELASYKLADAVNKSWGSPYNSENIRELLSVKSNIPVNTDADLNGNIITITLYVPGENDSRVAIDAINDIVASVNNKLIEAIGIHEIQALTSEQTITSSLTLAEDQFNNYNRFYNISNQLNSFSKILTEGQNAAYSTISQINEAVDESEGDQEMIIPDNNKSAGPFSPKNMIIGFVLGGVLYVLIYMVYFILSSKITSPSVLEESFGLRTLGEWDSDKCKGLRAFLLNDRLVYKLHHKGHLDMETELNRSKESIVNAFDAKENGKLLVVSNNKYEDNVHDYIEALTKMLGECGVVTDFAKVSISDGLSLGESVLKKNDNTVIIVDKNKSKINDVKEVLDKSMYCDVPVIGAIYVG